MPWNGPFYDEENHTFGIPYDPYFPKPPHIDPEPTDYADELQAAIDAAWGDFLAGPEGVAPPALYLEPGEYTISHPLILKVPLYGRVSASGRPKLLLDFDAQIANPTWHNPYSYIAGDGGGRMPAETLGALAVIGDLFIDGFSQHTYAKHGSMVRDIEIDASGTTADVNGIFIMGGTRIQHRGHEQRRLDYGIPECKIERVIIKGCHTGVYAAGVAKLSVIDSSMLNCTRGIVAGTDVDYGPGGSVPFGQTPGTLGCEANISGSVTIEGCVVGQASGNAVTLRGVVDATVDGCSVSVGSGGAGCALYSRHCSSLTVVGGEFSVVSGAVADIAGSAVAGLVAGRRTDDLPVGDVYTPKIPQDSDEDILYGPNISYSEYMTHYASRLSVHGGAFSGGRILIGAMWGTGFDSATVIGSGISFTSESGRIDSFGASSDAIQIMSGCNTSVTPHQNDWGVLDPTYDGRGNRWQGLDMGYDTADFVTDSWYWRPLVAPPGPSGYGYDDTRTVLKWPGAFRPKVIDRYFKNSGDDDETSVVGSVSRDNVSKLYHENDLLPEITHDGAYSAFNEWEAGDWTTGAGCTLDGLYKVVFDSATSGPYDPTSPSVAITPGMLELPGGGLSGLAELVRVRPTMYAYGDDGYIAVMCECDYSSLDRLGISTSGGKAMIATAELLDIAPWYDAITGTCISSGNRGSGIVVRVSGSLPPALSVDTDYYVYPNNHEYSPNGQPVLIREYPGGPDLDVGDGFLFDFNVTHKVMLQLLNGEPWGKTIHAYQLSWPGHELLESGVFSLKVVCSTNNNNVSENAYIEFLGLTSPKVAQRCIKAHRSDNDFGDTEYWSECPPEFNLTDLFKYPEKVWRDGGVYYGASNVPGIHTETYTPGIVAAGRYSDVHGFPTHIGWWLPPIFVDKYRGHRLTFRMDVELPGLYGTGKFQLWKWARYELDEFLDVVGRTLWPDVMFSDTPMGHFPFFGNILRVFRVISFSLSLLLKKVVDETLGNAVQLVGGHWVDFSEDWEEDMGEMVRGWTASTYNDGSIMKHILSLLMGEQLPQLRAYHYNTSTSHLDLRARTTGRIVASGNSDDEDSREGDSATRNGMEITFDLPSTPGTFFHYIHFFPASGRKYCIPFDNMFNEGDISETVKGLISGLAIWGFDQHSNLRVRSTTLMPMKSGETDFMASAFQPQAAPQGLLCKHWGQNLVNYLDPQWWLDYTDPADGYAPGELPVPDGAEEGVEGDIICAAPCTGSPTVAPGTLMIACYDDTDQGKVTFKEIS